MPDTSLIDGMLAHYLKKIDGIQGRCEIIADLTTDQGNLQKIAVINADSMTDCEQLARHIVELRKSLKSGPPPEPA